VAYRASCWRTHLPAPLHSFSTYALCVALGLDLPLENRGKRRASLMRSTANLSWHRARGRLRPNESEFGLMLELIMRGNGVSWIRRGDLLPCNFSVVLAPLHFQLFNPSLFISLFILPGRLLLNITSLYFCPRHRGEELLADTYLFTFTYLWGRVAEDFLLQS
jgi:hypothetical protein